MDAHNCTNPPHFPPHCGCPAGNHDQEVPVINADFTGHVVMSDNRVCNVPVGCDLAYEPESNPLTVSLTVQAGRDVPVKWIFGRDFLTEGYLSQKTHGEGDIKLKWFPQTSELGVCLHAVEGHAHLILPHRAVADFVHAMDAGHPAENIDTGAMVDDAISQILNQS